MPDDLSDFLDNLAIRQEEEFLFLGTPNQWKNRHVYGGHVISQAMEAAQRTVPAGFHIHSMHAYFLRPGNADNDIRYEVDPIRDGRSFLTRRVVAIQKGEALFISSISFHIGEEGISHQINMADVPAPESLESDHDYYSRVSQKLNRPYPKKNFMPFNQRYVDRVDVERPEPKPAVGGMWLKFEADLPDDPALHSRMLAYISDSHLMGSALRPHAMHFRDPHIKMMTSLDHSFFVHDPSARADEWFYYQMEGTWSGQGRVLGRGSMFNRTGKLIATTTQEGLVRLTEKAKLEMVKKGNP